jgi:putative hydrolase of the HAD superfamily
MSIRAVYFDLGGVIVRTEDKGPRTELGKSLGLDYDKMDRAVFGKESVQASLGIINEEQHWRNVVRALKLPESEISRIIEIFFAGDHIDQALVDFMRSLRPAIKVGLISNAWSGLRAWIINKKFDDAFDEMVISSEIGIAKPDARIYRQALEKLNIRPEEAVFVDDMPDNIEAAKALGMHGVAFKTSEQAIADVKNLLAGEH